MHLSSIPITAQNDTTMFTELYSYCFGEHNKDEWTEEDLTEAHEARYQIQWPKGKEQKKLFCVESWVSTYAAENKKWAVIVRNTPIFQYYSVCLHTPALLKHYKLAHIEKLELSARLKLLKLIETNPYSLCFADMYQADFPGLPELHLSTLSKQTIASLGPDKILNVWFYQALGVNEECKGDTCTMIEVRRGRHVVRFTGAHKPELQAHHEQFRGLLGDERKLLDCNNVSKIIEALEKQGSIVVRRIGSHKNEQLQVAPTRVWNRAITISNALRGFTRMVTELESELSETAQREVWIEEYTDDQVCDEQADALNMIAKNPVTIVTGPGGSGKTNILGKIKGHGEQVWYGDAKEVRDNPNNFFPVNSSRAKKRPTATAGVNTTTTTSAIAQEAKATATYAMKAEKIILTPTGRAARTVTKRHGITAFTVKWFLTWMQHNAASSRRFDKLRVLVIDETGMLDEPGFAEMLDRTLVELLRNADSLPNLRRLVMMGDKDQLESVGPGQVLEDLIGSWIPCARFVHNHRVTLASRQLADNAMAVARRELDKIVMDDKTFVVCTTREMPLVSIFERFRDTPMDFQMVCWSRELRDKVNADYMHWNGFVPKDPSVFASRCVWVGQKIVFVRNLSTKDCVVNNGQLEVITDMADTNMPDLYMSNIRDADMIVKPILCSEKPIEHKSMKRVVRCASGFTFALTTEVMNVIKPGCCVTLHTMQSAQAKTMFLVNDGTCLYNKFVYTWIGRAEESAVYLSKSEDQCPVQELAQSIKKPNRPRDTLLPLFLGDDATKGPNVSAHCICCAQDFEFCTDQVTEWPRMCSPCVEAATDTSAMEAPTTLTDVSA